MFSKGQTEHYAKLCKNLGYQFKDKTILMRALTRKSAIIEGKQQSDIGTYQRLEFLGDRVIDLAVSEILFTFHPNWNEGTLTTMKSHYVHNHGPLEKIAKSLGLDQFLIMGFGEEVNKINLNAKVLSDATEALFGAVFQDSAFNYVTVKALVKKHWAPLGLMNTKETEKPINTKKSVMPQDEIDKKLINAVEITDVEKVKLYLQQGGNPNLEIGCEDYIHRPLLACVIFRADRTLPIVTALLEHGAHSNSQNSFYRVNTNPAPNGKSISWYLKNNYKPQYKKIYTKDTAFHMLVESAGSYSNKETLEIAKLLTQYKANPLLRNSQGKTPLEVLTSSQSYKQAKANPKLVKSDEEISKLPILDQVSSYNFGAFLELEKYFKSLPEYQPKVKITPLGLKNVMEQEIHNTLSIAIPELGDDMLDQMTSEFSNVL